MKSLYPLKPAKPNPIFKIILSTLDKLSSNLLLFLTFILFLPHAQAQIIPDTTLPVNSRVIPQGNTNLIEGGTQTGSNLFHSFREFSVPTATEAFFNNNLNIKNIFTRVTGNSISNIDGLIRANGNANFFLINPNGIIFGNNAKLNIGGSFLATTANSIKFSDGAEFSASNPQSSPLLTVSVPIGLQYGNISAGEIRIQGKGQDLYNQKLGTTNNFDSALNPLSIPPGNTLALLGGNIIIDGGIIQASSSSVQLGGLSGEGTIDINPDGSFTFPDNARADILITNKAGINVVSPNGGNININARNLEISGESFISGGIPTGKGTSDTIAGDISLNATGAIAISASRIENSINTDAMGKSGNINITTNSLTLSQGALLDASIFGKGSGGDINIFANDTLFFGGNNNQSSAGIQTTVGQQGSGNAGNVNITAKSLRITNGSSINTNTLNQGKAGNVNIIASDTVFLDGTQNGQASSTIASNLDANAVGDAGSINITTGSLILTNGAALDVSTRGKGDAGNITIVASNNVSFDGVGEKNPGGVNSSVGGTAVGNGGNIKIIAQSLSATNGAGLTTNTFGIGNAGSITIVASDSVDFNTQGNNRLSGALTTVTQNAEGDAGSISITSKYLNISNNAILESSSKGNGAAGNIIVEANIINLNNNAQISTDSLGGVNPTTKDQANIRLQSASLILDNNSLISTNAEGSNIVGGNIIINSDTIAALGNSDISANSLNDRGGNVTINSQGIFGAQSRTTEELQVLLNTKNTNQLNPRLLSTSDITATGADASLSGTVSINTPNVNPSAGLVELATNPIDPNTMIASTCGNSPESNKFFVSGKGGLPPNPNEPLMSESTWIDVRGTGGLEDQGSRRRREGSSQRYLNNHRSPIVEAQGWKINSQGEIVLVVEAPNLTLANSALTPQHCPSAPASSASLN